MRARQWISCGFLGVFLAVALIGAGCGGGGTDPGDGGDDGDGGGGDGQATFVKPAGYASLTFFVDDTANRTYNSGDLEWKGSFLYDPLTNIALYDAAWAGEIGPYPVLYDDGPIAQGGHEMPGATAGDHIFSVEVYVKAEVGSDTEFQYGAINEFDNWIWEGPNGTVVLPAGSTDRIDAAGFFLHAFGTYDLKVTLDVNNLDADFLPFDPATQRIYLKGSMNSWDRRQLLDNGDVSKGDLVAGDGIYTYWHSVNLGPHDGLLWAGQHVQFVFMIDALEYKKRGDALEAGVTAETDCGAGFLSAPIYLELESRGKVKNTTVTVCEGSAGVTVSSVVPGNGPPAGGTAVAVYGTGFVDGALVTFGDQPAADVVFIGAGQVNCTSPAHDPGRVAVRVTNPDQSFGELADAFTYASGQAPELLFVQPGIGPTAGGTLVTLTGRNFAAGATVTFGGLAATEVAVPAAEQITCRTPAHAVGAVTVTVSNPDGLSSSYPGGFEYSDASGPVVQRLEPNFGPTTGGTLVTVHGGGFSSGASVEFDSLPASDIQVTGDYAIQCTTPAHAEGAVPVRVYNPGGEEFVLPNGFSYQKPQVDWAVLQWPLSLSLNAGQTSEPIFGRTYEPGMTEETGCSGAIQAEVGWGPAGSDPTQDASGWSFAAAACNPTCADCGNNDEYVGTLAVPTPGSYAFAYRFSLDSGGSWAYADGGAGTLDGYQPAQAGQLTVRDTGDELQLWEVDPPAGSVLGGTPITVLGNAFEDGAIVRLAGVELATTFVDAHSLTAVAPAHAAGSVEVAVINPGASHPTTSLIGAYTYVLRASPAPVLDGEIGADWDPAFLAAENTIASDWGDNRLERLYLAFDDSNLYLGIAGYAETGAGNVIVAYLDADFGPQSGWRDLRGLTDDDGALDAAVSSAISVTAGGFGAEFAAGTKGMAQTEGQAPDAGLRFLPLGEPGNFHWMDSIVKTGATAVELALPWAQLTGGLPVGAVRMAVFVRLVNADGQYLSNACLPPDDPAQPGQVGAVFTFDVR